MIAMEFTIKGVSECLICGKAFKLGDEPRWACADCAAKLMKDFDERHEIR